MAELATKKDKYLSPKFECKICDYITVTKCNLSRHFLSSKHILATKIDKWQPKNDKNDKYCKTLVCKICNKIYQDRSGLWRHKQKCNKKVKTIVDTLHNDFDLKQFLFEQNKQFLEQLSQQNIQIIEQNNKLISIAENNSNSNKCITNNTTNNSFNLNFFLNETCKDVLNITDFVNQLQLSVKDLEETGRLGYAEGISKIFINGLKQLDVSKRPLHCSDIKRETMYIKDENHWTNENIILTNAIKDVAHKNIQQIPIWIQANPEHKDISSKCNDRYMKLVSESMSGTTMEESDKNYKKIARNIMKESVIDK